LRFLRSVAFEYLPNNLINNHPKKTYDATDHQSVVGGGGSDQNKPDIYNNITSCVEMVLEYLIFLTVIYNVRRTNTERKKYTN
jgi:hypothetical protein